MPGDLRLSFGDAIELRHCTSCGGEIRSGQGFVESGIDALAVYWFDLHTEGDDRRARILVALDSAANPDAWEWGEAFGVEVRSEPDQLACALVDADQAPVPPDPTDPVHDRDDGLRSSQVSLLWEIVDAVVADDVAMAEFLANDAV